VGDGVGVGVGDGVGVGVGDGLGVGVGDGVGVGVGDGVGVGVGKAWANGADHHKQMFLSTRLMKPDEDIVTLEQLHDASLETAVTPQRRTPT